MGSISQKPRQPARRRPTASPRSCAAISFFSASATPRLPRRMQQVESAERMISRFFGGRAAIASARKRSRSATLVSLTPRLLFRGFRVLLDQPGHPGRGHAAVVLPVHGHDRAEGAGAEAVHRLDGEEAVLRGRPGRGVEPALQLVEDALRAAHVAGRAHADLHDVPAARREAEGLVEAGRAVDLGPRDAEARGDAVEHRLGQPVELLLRILQHHDQPLPAAAVGVDDLVHPAGSRPTARRPRDRAC